MCDCPKCGIYIDDVEKHASITNSGESYNTEFGQTEYWWDGTVTCPHCEHKFDYEDTSL